MAFAFANSGSAGFGNTVAQSNAQTQTGPDLEEIQTEGLGFHSLAGEVKIRLLPSPWPSDALPHPTASLLSIASRRGLLAAAGPESVVIAGTESVRQAFSASVNAENNIKPFTPQLTLDVGTRVSQVAFSADENYLVISAENGGGLAVYDVPDLMQGNTAAAFQLATKGASLRSLIPNPTPEKAELFAVITNNGELMMANLKSRKILRTAQSQVMKEGVSCVSWSPRGKQLVAGLGNGTCYQMTPEGEGKAELPSPPGLQGEHHVASIFWLETNVFLIGHTQTTLDDPLPPPTTFHVVTRQTQNQGTFSFQKLPEVCAPFGLNRSPPHFFMQRLKDFPPNIQDLILVASTASGDIGLFSRAKAPLASDFPPEQITSVFTTTQMANDSRRAQLPMSESMEDTSPIGTVIDLSAKEKVLRPLPSEEMDSSPGPVPALMVLNNEGLLSAWWVIYADSIRQGTTFPGLVSVSSQTPSQQQGTPQPTMLGSTSSQSTPAFDQPTLGAAANTGVGGTGTGKPSESLFGGGNAAGPPAFGAPSAPAASSSPWTSGGFTNVNPQSGTSSFGKPSFGSPSSIGGLGAAPAFGATGGIGKSTSAWGAASSGTPQTGGSVFGQSGSLGMRAGSVFGASTTSGTFGSGATSTAPSQGGFASFAQGAGFHAAQSKAQGKSPFAQSIDGPTPSSTADTDMSFGGTPQKKDDAPKGLFSTGTFKLGSTFTGDGSATTDLPKPTTNAKSSLFGDGFGSALGEVQKDVPTAQSKEAAMTEDDSDMAGSEASSGTPPTQNARTPAPKDAQPSFNVTDTSTPKLGGVFGTQSQASTTPAAVQTSTPAPSIFGKNVPTSTPSETPQKQNESPLSSQTPPSPSIKPEPEDQGSPVGVSKSIPEAPLPPESTSKVSYAPGDSSNSSKSSAEDAPLPPDWFPTKTKLNSVEKPPKGVAGQNGNGGDAPLPPDFLPSTTTPKVIEKQAEEEPGLPPDEEDDGLDDEGSGVDVAQEISPTSDPNQSPRITPGSSFGASFGPSPVGGMFNKVQQPRQNVKSLFGEVQQPNVPFLPPPSRTQESPRSPSPVRLMPPGDALRPENARSISAPGRPNNTAALQKPGMLSGTTKPPGAQQHRPLGSSAVLTERQTAREQRQNLSLAAAAQRVRQQAEEEQGLSDREDERVREELEREVEPTKTLDDFLAHQDYVGTVTKPGIPGLIEKVYRDINSMIDTLGLNARSLQAFVKGHSTMAKDGGRSFDDLDDPDWCLVEIGDLLVLEGELEAQLDQVRLTDVQGKLNVCRDLRKDLSKLRRRRIEMSRFLEAVPDRKETDNTKFAPLTATQSSKQHELRKAYTKVQKLVAEAEENITLLRASLASHDTSDGQMASKKPTVEAVTNTIRKMTSMIQKKSGDIDVLEAQMRKLRLTPVNQDRSREGSPFAGGSSAVKNPSAKTMQSTMSGFVDSPSSSLRRSTGDAGSPRRRMSSITPEDVSTYRSKVQRRREVNQIMHEAFAKAGPRLRPME